MILLRAQATRRVRPGPRIWTTNARPLCTGVGPTKPPPRPGLLGWLPWPPRFTVRRATNTGRARFPAVDLSAINRSADRVAAKLVPHSATRQTIITRAKAFLWRHTVGRLVFGAKAARARALAPLVRQKQRVEGRVQQAQLAAEQKVRRLLLAGATLISGIAAGYVGASLLRTVVLVPLDERASTRVGGGSPPRPEQLRAAQWSATHKTAQEQDDSQSATAVPADTEDLVAAMVLEGAHVTGADANIEQDVAHNSTAFGPILRRETAAFTGGRRVLYEDAEYMAFSNRTHYAPLALLVIPRWSVPHDPDALAQRQRQPLPATSERESECAMVGRLVVLGRRLVQEQNPSAFARGDYSLRFHRRPFNSVDHLHLVRWHGCPAPRITLPREL